MGVGNGRTDGQGKEKEGWKGRGGTRGYLGTGEGQGFGLEWDIEQVETGQGRAEGRDRQ